MATNAHIHAVVRNHSDLAGSERWFGGCPWVHLDRLVEPAQFIGATQNPNDRVSFSEYFLYFLVGSEGQRNQHNPGLDPVARSQPPVAEIGQWVRV
jgi:hypothetical protein